MSITAGAATRVINPELGDALVGQMHPRFCTYMRDNLEANFLYLASAQEQLLLVNLDLGGLENGLNGRLRDAIAAGTGMLARNIILTSTHTHSGPDTLLLLHDNPDASAYHTRLEEWLVDGAHEAISSACSAKIGSARGVAHVGYNRRLCWADGTHSMYGDVTRTGFIGLEGPDDPAHAVLFAVDAAGEYIAILHNNCSHATCMENSDFVTADFPGEARALIRTALHRQLPVLYLQGASGDTSPWNQLHTPTNYDGGQRAREMGAMLAGETLRLLHDAPLDDDPVFSHIVEDAEIGVRLPTPEALAQAREMIKLGEEATGRWDYVLSLDGIVRLYEAYKDHPVDYLPIHALRIGDFGLCSNPCELYCQFGLDIKRRSPAPITAVVQLADGFSGYCPTIPALMGGGYSGDAIYWTRLEPYAGYKIVETATRLLHQLWTAEIVRR